MFDDALEKSADFLVAFFQGVTLRMARVAIDIEEEVPEDAGPDNREEAEIFHASYFNLLGVGRATPALTGLRSVDLIELIDNDETILGVYFEPAFETNVAPLWQGVESPFWRKHAFDQKPIHFIMAARTRDDPIDLDVAKARFHALAKTSAHENGANHTKSLLQWLDL
jgi:hypothetical protein